jgi:chromosome segregation ATPase
MGQHEIFSHNLPVQAYRDDEGNIQIINYMPRRNACAEISLDELIGKEDITDLDRQNVLYGTATNLLNLALLFVEFAEGKRDSVYYHDKDHEKHFPPCTYRNIVDMFLRIGEAQGFSHSTATEKGRPSLCDEVEIIAEKDNEIAELKRHFVEDLKDVTELEDEIASLQQQLTEKDKQIIELKALMMKSAETVTRLQGELEEKDKEIEELKADIEVYRGELGYRVSGDTLPSVLKSGERIKCGLCEAKNNKIASLQSDLAESYDLNTAQAKKISTLDKIIDNRTELVADLNKENIELKDKVEALQNQLTEKDKEIARLKQGICEHVATDEIVSGCRLCEMAIAEEGYHRWVKKAEEKDKEIEELNKKLYQTKEVLAGMILSYEQLMSLIYKTHIITHVSPLNPPETCTICKDLKTASENVEKAQQVLEMLEVEALK